MNTQLGTGAPRQLQAAFFDLSGEYRHVRFGRLGIDSVSYSDMIGAIDAPDVMPAGAMNSIEWTNGAGRPVAHANEIRREN